MLVDKALRDSHLVSEILANDDMRGRRISSPNLKRCRSTPVAFRLCLVKLKELGHHAWPCLEQRCVGRHLHIVQCELALLRLRSM